MQVETITEQVQLYVDRAQLIILFRFQVTQDFTNLINIHSLDFSWSSPYVSRWASSLHLHYRYRPSFLGGHGRELRIVACEAAFLEHFTISEMLAALHNINFYLTVRGSYPETYHEYTNFFPVCFTLDNLQLCNE